MEYIRLMIIVILISSGILLNPSAAQSKMNTVTDTTGQPWIQGQIPSALVGQSVVFQTPSAPVYDYDLYIEKEGRFIPLQRNIDAKGITFKSRFPQYRFVPEDTVFYIHLHQEANLPLTLSIQESHAFETDESKRMLQIGLYCGLAFMSLIFNLVFYLIFKDRRFITYGLLMIGTFLSFFYEDGMFYYLTDGKWTMDYLIVWNSSFTAMVSVAFTYYFLGLEKQLHSYKKWYYLASMILLTVAQVYTLTDNLAILTLSHLICFLFASTCICLAITRFKKDVYARFLTIAFGLVVLTGLAYVLNTQLKWSAFAFFDINIFRLFSALEIISISFAIIYKVRALQEENERYRSDLNSYLLQLEYHNSTREVIPEPPAQTKIEDLLFPDQEETQTHPYESVLLHTEIKSKADLAKKLQKEHELTNRELEVLLAIWEGLSNKEIAEKYNVTLSTVKYHVSNLYLKLDVRNRNQVQILRNAEPVM